jgi:hypothetical protein
MTSDPNSPPTDKKKYLSLLMTLMYLARFTRPDILMPLSFLASKCSKPTQEDFSKLMRILRYTSGTKKDGLTFLAKTPFQPSIAADASHLLYDSGHGQKALIISNGSAPVGFKCSKISMITRSSSESELVALEDASTYGVWYNQLLEFLGVKTNKPTTIYQDNKSTIIMAIQGGSFKRTKHLIGRQNFVRERVQNGDIVLAYLPTKDMPADILTKPVKRVTLEKLKHLLHVGPVV